MADRTAILVTGSREFPESRAHIIRDRLARYPRGSILLHGNARGADTWAANAGNSLGFLEWPLSYFGDLGARGGHARNYCMYRVLVTLIEAGFKPFVEAFPIGASPGTRGMLRIVGSYNDAAFYDGLQREKHHEPIPVFVTEAANG